MNDFLYFTGLELPDSEDVSGVRQVHRGAETNAYNHDKKIAVFIEDVVLVTEEGAEVLTDMLPRSTAGLEKLMEAK